MHDSSIGFRGSNGISKSMSLGEQEVKDKRTRRSFIRHPEVGTPERNWIGGTMPLDQESESLQGPVSAVCLFCFVDEVPVTGVAEAVFSRVNIVQLRESLYKAKIGEEKRREISIVTIATRVYDDIIQFT